MRFPHVPPADRVLAELHVLGDFLRRQEERERDRRHNGRGPSRAVVERERAVVEELQRRWKADSRPLTERVPEYVLRYDDDGSPVGIVKRSSER